MQITNYKGQFTKKLQYSIYKLQVNYNIQLILVLFVIWYCNLDIFCSLEFVIWNFRRLVVSLYCCIVIKNMSKNKPFVIQLVIVGGFLIFIYIFFALAASVYKDYKLELNIEKFENAIENLAEMASQKPKDVKYYQSEEYKDKYAKESLNLLNPGEKLIIIPNEEKIVKSEVIVESFYHENVLKLPNRNQWWEYFVGRTLSVEIKQEDDDTTKQSTSDEQEDEETEQPLNEGYNVDEESLLEIEG